VTIYLCTIKQNIIFGYFFSQNIPENKSIKIFGLLQHSHLLGVGIKTRHIRNDTELSPIAEDDNYDFDYQDIRALKEEREVKRVSTI
jgi:hypothetical protein